MVTEELIRRIKAGGVPVAMRPTTPTLADTLHASRLIDATADQVPSILEESAVEKWISEKPAVEIAFHLWNAAQSKREV